MRLQKRQKRVCPRQSRRGLWQILGENRLRKATCSRSTSSVFFMFFVWIWRISRRSFKSGMPVSTSKSNWPNHRRVESMELRLWGSAVVRRRDTRSSIVCYRFVRRKEWYRHRPAKSIGRVVGILAGKLLLGNEEAYRTSAFSSHLHLASLFPCFNCFSLRQFVSAYSFSVPIAPSRQEQPATVPYWLFCFIHMTISNINASIALSHSKQLGWNDRPNDGRTFL